jgi:hypothetical protein
MERRMAILLGGARRFIVILAVLAGITAAGAWILTELAGWNANRVIASAFDLVGSFLLVIGFVVGNRGPARLKGEGGMPFFGPRHVRWADADEREAAMADSAVFVSVGVAMIIIGIAIDSRYRLY